MEHAHATWTVRTDVFDGPLDLLLHLVRREGVDISRLSMVTVCDGYLEYLERLRELHLEIAADYLVMAATLVWLKSLELLPRPPTILASDDAEDPREALARRLEAYQRYRDAADALDVLPRVGRDVFVREPAPPDEAGEPPLVAGIDAFALLDRYWELLRRERAPEPVHTVAESGPDLETCVRRVLDVLGASGGATSLDRLLEGLRRRVERVLTFLATLEMARLGWLDLRQETHLGAVRLALRQGADLRLDLLVGRLQGETA